MKTNYENEKRIEKQNHRKTLALLTLTLGIIAGVGMMTGCMKTKDVNPDGPAVHKDTNQNTNQNMNQTDTEKDLWDEIQDTTMDLKDDAKDALNDTVENTKDIVDTTKDKVEETTDHMKEDMSNGGRRR